MKKAAEKRAVAQAVEAVHRAPIEDEEEDTDEEDEEDEDENEDEEHQEEKKKNSPPVIDPTISAQVDQIHNTPLEDIKKN